MNCFTLFRSIWAAIQSAFLIDNTKEKAPDFSRAFELIRMVPDC
jgi:hypothetical protein